MKFNAGVYVRVPVAVIEYVPIPAIIRSELEFPVFPALLGSIRIIDDGITVPSASVSFTPIVFTVIGLSSNVELPVSSFATGASLIPLMVMVNVAVADPPFPSDNS